MRVAVATEMQVNSPLPANGSCDERDKATSFVAQQASGLVEQLISDSFMRLAAIPAINLPSDQTMEWPTGDNITPQRGIEAIEACIQRWRVDSSWKHYVSYLGADDTTHKFCVRWSVSTRRRPVPKATASVYFFLRPRNDLRDPVLALYMVEGQRSVHRPEQTVFQEVWLKNTIEHKYVTTERVSLIST